MEIERRYESWPPYMRIGLEGHFVYNMEFMASFWDAASACPSLHEIWTVKYNDSSLASITGGFAPWYDDALCHYQSPLWCHLII